MVEVAGAGVGAAAGEHAVPVAQDHRLAHPGGWVVGVDGVVAAQVEDGTDHHPAAAGLAAGVAVEADSGEPGFEEGQGGGPEPLNPAAAGSGRAGGQVGQREVQIDHRTAGPGSAAGAAGSRRVGASAGLPRLPVSGPSGLLGLGVGGVEEVQDALRAGQQPQGMGASPVEVVGVAQCLELGGGPGQGVVEVERVQGVQHPGDRGGRGGLAVVEPDPASGQGGFLDPGGGVGVVLQQRLVDRGPDPVTRQRPAPGEDGEVAVHEPGRRPGQVGGLHGRAAGLPRRQHPGLHQVPQARQPVPQLQRVGHQLTAGPVGHRERGGEVDRRGLGHLRRAVPAPPRRVVPGHQAAGLGEDRVQVGPVRHPGQQIGLRTLRRAPPTHHERQHRRVVE